MRGISHFRALDVALRGRADSLLGAVQDSEDAEDNVMLYGTEGLAPRRDIYIVRDDRGRVIGSQGWPGGEQELTSSDTREFRSLNVGGIRYRVIRRVDCGSSILGMPKAVLLDMSLFFMVPARTRSGNKSGTQLLSTRSRVFSFW